MQVVQARATFVTPETVDESLTTIVARSVLEAALQEEESAELWFELAKDDGDDVSRLSIDLSYSDIEELLRLSPEDEIALSLDGEAVESLFDDADVEAHGLRGVIAIAVTSAALLAPGVAQAAVPQATQQAKPAGDGAGERRCDGAGLEPRREDAGHASDEDAGLEDPGRQGQRPQASPQRSRAVAARLIGLVASLRDR